MSQPNSTATVEFSTDAHGVPRDTGMPPSLPPIWTESGSKHSVLEDARRSTRRRRAHILTYLDDLDHDLTVVEYRAGSNNTNIQETMQRLIVLERKILRINMVINKYLLRQEGISLGRNAAMTGGHLADTFSFVFLLVISLSFVVMAVHDLGK